MQEPSIQSEPVTKTQKNEQLPYYKLLCAVERQIEKVRQLNQQKDIPQNHENVKIQESVPPQETSPPSIKSEQSAFKPYVKDEFDDLFNQESSYERIPLKIVNTKSIEKQFETLFKTLKRNSSFPHLIPINTMVLAKIDDELIWPTKIIQMNQIQKTLKNKKITYKVEVINRNRCTQLFKYNILEFSLQNRQRLRKFTNDKKLLKSLKIAEKLCQQNENSVIKFQDKEKIPQEFKAKFVKNILLRGQHVDKSKAKYFKTQNSSRFLKRESWISRVSKNRQNLKKWEPLDLIIETPKIDPQQFISGKQSQLHFDELVKQEAEEDFIEKVFEDEETYFIEQEKSKRQNFFESLSNHKTEFFKTEQTRKKKTQKDQHEHQKQNFEKELFLNKIVRYVHDYKKQLKNIGPKRKKKTRSDHVFILFNLPLEKFKKQDVSKYAKIIDESIEICQIKSSNLNKHHQSFIHGIKQSIRLIYRYLMDYQGQSMFVKVLKSNSFLKLKNFVEEVQKNIKGQN